MGQNYGGFGPKKDRPSSVQGDLKLFLGEDVGNKQRFTQRGIHGRSPGIDSGADALESLI